MSNQIVNTKLIISLNLDNNSSFFRFKAIDKSYFVLIDFVIEIYDNKPADKQDILTICYDKNLTKETVKQYITEWIDKINGPKKDKCNFSDEIDKLLICKPKSQHKNYDDYVFINKIGNNLELKIFLA